MKTEHFVKVDRGFRLYLYGRRVWPRDVKFNVNDPSIKFTGKFTLESDGRMFIEVEHDQWDVVDVKKKFLFFSYTSNDYALQRVRIFYSENNFSWRTTFDCGGENQ